MLLNHRERRELSVDRPHSITPLDDHKAFVKHSNYNMSGTLKPNNTKERSASETGEKLKTLNFSSSNLVKIKDYQNIKQETKKLLNKPVQERFNKIKEKYLACFTNIGTNNCLKTEEGHSIKLK